jgi:FdhD protein
MPPPASPLSEGSSRSVSILRFAASGVSAVADAVATEEPLEIQVSFERHRLRVVKPVAITMRTPGEDRDLAAGFLFTEGIIRDAGQIEECTAAPADSARGVRGDTVRVTLRPGADVDLRALDRHFYTASSCGVCGKTALEALRLSDRIALEPNQPQVEAAWLRSLPAVLRSRQSVFDHTGGLHAAGLFAAEGELLAVREDVGRHNAVDKLIGAQLLAGTTSLAGHVLLVSGRASFELMQKALMAGIPILAAVGAPSSLAVDLARQFGATLLGFVGDRRFNVYSGAHRLRPAGVAAEAEPMTAFASPAPSFR